jgi:hypothetical protein
VPHVVQREAEQGEAAAGGSEHAADGDVPLARDADGGVAGLSLRQRERQAAGCEDAVEPNEDEVVRRVGERARIAALVDVQGDVPVHAQQRHEQRAARQARRQRRPRRKAGDALGELGHAPQGPALAAAVAEDAHQQQGGGDAGHARGDGDLIERRAARGLGGGEERPGRREEL